MEDKNRNGRTVTTEHKREAAALRRLWENRRDPISQEAFGLRYDIGNQSAVGFFLNGKSALSLKAAKGFALGLGCVVGDFSPRLAQEIAELAQAAGIGWPFPLIDRTRWEVCTPEDRIYVQGVLDHALNVRSEGKHPPRLTFEAVQKDAIPDRSDAHRPASTSHLTADKASYIGHVTGGLENVGDQHRGVEGKKHHRGSSRAARKG